MTDETRVLLSLPIPSLERLDKLCGVNERSRPKLVKILIDQAYEAYKKDETERLNPVPVK